VRRRRIRVLGRDIETDPLAVKWQIGVRLMDDSSGRLRKLRASEE
jgi:hypothetical protein